jgi:hypothetical protein
MSPAVRIDDAARSIAARMMRLMMKMPVRDEVEPTAVGRPAICRVASPLTPQLSITTSATSASRWPLG